MERLRLSRGFTFAEMIVTVAILGTLVAIAAPKFTELAFDSKLRKSQANIVNIQQAFLRHYYSSTFAGQAEFPPNPPDSLMTREWSLIPSLYDGTYPAFLFANGEIPYNPDGHEYIYFQLPPDKKLKLSIGFKIRDPDYKLEEVLRL